ncbi:helix-turn-helix domain-containing protein [Trueperella pyogenes]
MKTSREVLSPEQAAKYLGVSVRTMQGWRTKGIGPRFGRVGKTVRYSAAELERWLKANG